MRPEGCRHASREELRIAEASAARSGCSASISTMVALRGPLPGNQLARAALRWTPAFPRRASPNRRFAMVVMVPLQEDHLAELLCSRPPLRPSRECAKSLASSGGEAQNSFRYTPQTPPERIIPAKCCLPRPLPRSRQPPPRGLGERCLLSALGSLPIFQYNLDEALRRPLAGATITVHARGRCQGVAQERHRLAPRQARLRRSAKWPCGNGFCNGSRGDSLDRVAEPVPTATPRTSLELPRSRPGRSP